MSRYRSQFASVRSVHISIAQANDKTWTWLPNEAAIWNVILGFLDECLAISDSIDFDPMLHIGRGDSFWIEVVWPNDESSQWVRDIGLENPEIELVQTAEVIGLRLHITFPASKQPAAARAFLAKSA